MREMMMGNRNISELRAVFLCGGTIVPVFIIGAVLSCGPAIATSSSASVTVSLACSMTGNTTTPHTAEIPNGVDSRGNDYYPDGIGTTTLKVFCNDNEGFSIYAIGYGDNTMGNTYLRDNSLGSTKDILTSTTFSGPNSAWAMKIGVVAGTYAPIIAGSTGDTEKQSGDTDYSDWASIPNIYTRIAYRNSGTDINNTDNPNASGANVTTTYAAYISPIQSAGTYIGQVKYTLVHPASEVPLQPQPTTAGQICYYPNGSKVEGTMGCQSVSSSVTLLASNFSREGYGFAGWSDKYDYSTGANFYGPQETITLNTADYSGSNPGLSLYAVWVKSAGNLQDSSKVASLCGTGTGSLTQAPTDGTANLSSVSALTDQRDNETYAIAKLADGKCWMIENLRLEAEDTRTPEKQALAQGYGTSATYGNFGGLANAESANFSISTTANSLYYSGTQSGDATIDIGTTNYPGYRMPRYNNINTSARASNPTNNSGNMYSYGNYYTWHAAIANLTYNGTNNQSTIRTSLCPAGWHLPKGGDKTNEANNELWSLVVSGINGGTKPANYGSSTKPYYDGTPEGSDASNKLRAYPNNFLYSGYFSSWSAYGRGSYGSYWSSTANYNSLSYHLRLNSSNVFPGTDYNNKFYGLSIRCTVGT